MVPYADVSQLTLDTDPLAKIWLHKQLGPHRAVQAEDFRDFPYARISAISLRWRWSRGCGPRDIASRRDSGSAERVAPAPARGCGTRGSLASLLRGLPGISGTGTPRAPQMKQPTAAMKAI